MTCTLFSYLFHTSSKQIFLHTSLCWIIPKLKKILNTRFCWPIFCHSFWNIPYLTVFFSFLKCPPLLIKLRSSAPVSPVCGPGLQEGQCDPGPGALSVHHTLLPQWKLVQSHIRTHNCKFQGRVICPYYHTIIMLCVQDFFFDLGFVPRCFI